MLKSTAILSYLFIASSWPTTSWGARVCNFRPLFKVVIHQKLRWIHDSSFPDTGYGQNMRKGKLLMVTLLQTVSTYHRMCSRVPAYVIPCLGSGVHPSVIREESNYFWIQKLHLLRTVISYGFYFPISLIECLTFETRIVMIMADSLFFNCHSSW